MPGTLQGLALALIAILPGALYVWSYERQAGQWRVGSPDRLLNFLGVSVVLHTIAAPATFWVWRHYWHTGDLQAASHVPWDAYGVLGLYLVVPAILGFLVGLGTRHRIRIIQRVHERTPPRAWDFLFDQPFDGWLRIKTKSGAWIGGAVTKDSWVSTHPSEGDLLLTVVSVDPTTGEWTETADGKVKVLEGSQVLVRWNEIEYLQVDPG
jgi:hypothetical protein